MLFMHDPCSQVGRKIGVLDIFPPGMNFNFGIFRSDLDPNFSQKTPKTNFMDGT